MSCPGYTGPVVWDRNCACYEGKRIDDKMLAEFCDDCRDCILDDMESVLSERQEYLTKYSLWLAASRFMGYT